jgi:hypothetical protein
LADEKHIAAITIADNRIFALQNIDDSLGVTCYYSLRIIAEAT